MDPNPNDSKEFFDEAGASQYRSLAPDVVANSVSTSDGSFSLPDEGDTYRDLGGFDVASAALGAATFDGDAEGVYRSLAAFPGQSAAAVTAASVANPNFLKGASPSSVDVSSAAAIPKNLPVPPPVPNPPFQLESSHFPSKGDSSTTLTALGELLKKNEVDATFKPAKFKFKCVAYPGYERVVFNIRLYSRGEQDRQQIVVEFQRKRGGALHYRSVYTAVKEGMEERSLAPNTITTAADVPTVTAGQLPPRLYEQCFCPPPVLLTKEDAAAAEDSASQHDVAVKSLLDMAAEAEQQDKEKAPGAADSGKGDDDKLEVDKVDPTAARNAAAAVAAMTEGGAGSSQRFDGPALKRFLEAGHAESTVSLLRSADMDVQRCAAAAIANLCERQGSEEGSKGAKDRLVAADCVRELVAVVQKAHGEGAGEPLSDGGFGISSARMECVRQCMRALALFADTHGEALEAVGALELGERLLAAGGKKDERMAKSVTGMMAAVSVNEAMLSGGAAGMVRVK